MKLLKISKLLDGCQLFTVILQNTNEMQEELHISASAIN